MTSGARTRPTTHLRRAAPLAAALLLALLLPAAAGAYAAPASQRLASGGQTWVAEANVRQERELVPVSRWGHDYLHARYYSNTLGRFVSVDPKGGSTGNSQSWNRYSYVLNNPIKLLDPDGNQEVPSVKPEVPKPPNPFSFFKRFMGSQVMLIQRDEETTKRMQQALQALRGAGVVDEMLEAAARPDRNRMTRAGRELQKHSKRGSEVFKASSQKPSDLNREGQQIVSDIVNDPDSMAVEKTVVQDQELVEVVDVTDPKGRGVRFKKLPDGDLELYSFREPNN